MLLLRFAGKKHLMTTEMWCFLIGVDCDSSVLGCDVSWLAVTDVLEVHCSGTAGPWSWSQHAAPKSQ
jgi:hypothetical protein